MLLLGWVPLAAGGSPTYHVTIDPDLSGLQVRVCDIDKRLHSLVNTHPQARKHLQWMRLESDRTSHALRPRHGVVRLTSSAPDSCVAYAVDFRGKIAHSWFSSRQQTSKQVLVDIDRWLWYPQPFPDSGVPITVQVPKGLSVSAPWRLVARTVDSASYLILKRPLEWEARMAVGDFPVTDLHVNNAQVRIAVLNGNPAVNEAEILRWIESNLTALSLTYGAFPVPDLQVLVVPVGKDTEPVPWGHVLRGGGDAVHVYIDQTRPLEEFLADWVLIHELSHLLHPRLRGRDAWLYEGLGSYYQNVLRARAGLLTQQQAWQKLNDGFQRGVKATGARHTLLQESENMLRDRNFMRVYWSGAAIFLLADQQLREQSGGQNSLDRVLKQFRDCCLPTDRWWSGEELMANLDSLSGATVFSDLYQRYVPSTDFPDPGPTYRKLGLTVTNGTVELSDNATQTELRNAIMLPNNASP